MNFLLFLTLTTSLISYSKDNCIDSYIGIYSNQKLKDYPYNDIFVQVEYKDETTLNMKVNIPCGTKVTPALYEASITNCHFVETNLISAGSSQCSMGNNPDFYIDEGNIIIRTNIQTPGFDGVYRINRLE